MSRAAAYPMGATFRVLPWGQDAHRLGRVVEHLPDHITACVVLAFADGRRGAFAPSELAAPVPPELRPVWAPDTVVDGTAGRPWRVQEIGPGGSGPYLRGPDGRYRTFATAAAALAWIAELPADPCALCRTAAADGSGILKRGGPALHVPPGEPARLCASCAFNLDDAGALDGAPVFDSDLATVDGGDR